MVNQYVLVNLPITDCGHIFNLVAINFQRIKRKYVSTSRLAVSQVTQEMLENIAYKSSGKQHSVNGTTCHQCR